MNHLLIFFVVQAAIIALCAWVYVSVANFPNQDEGWHQANGALGLKDNRSPAGRDEAAGSLRPAQPAGQPAESPSTKSTLTAAEGKVACTQSMK